MAIFWLSYNGSALRKNGYGVSITSGGSIPQRTFRFQLVDGYRNPVPSFVPVSANLQPGPGQVIHPGDISQFGTWTSVDQANAIWDWTNTASETDYSYAFNSDTSSINDVYFNMIGVGDTSKATNMSMMFVGGRILNLMLFDTSSVTDMSRMCVNCYNITEIPLFDLSSVTNMDGAFYNCYYVQSGALDLYRRASSKETVPSHSRTFYSCGYLTESGRAELNQIPYDWKSF
jgi:hypothetical protein